jgi:hypothetical protein
MIAISNVNAAVISNVKEVFLEFIISRDSYKLLVLMHQDKSKWPVLQI